MCGICGVADFAQQPDAAIAARMASLIAHRGPDAGSSRSLGPVAFGHRRLSIIDLSSEGDQPMTGHGATITFNGEIYNYRELRDELTRLGHQFRTKTDTEAILAAYRQWGFACLEHLNGIFAFALWDAERERLFCARDRLGVKPFYYRECGSRLAFASEAKALLDPRLGPVPDVDPDGLTNYLAFGHAVGRRTMWRGLSKLAPGHFLLVGRDGIAEREYWDVPFIADPHMSEAQAVAGVRAGLERAVARQMVADVPVGAFLSGGVDSSAIVALMQQQSMAPVKTFAIGFPEGGYNELGDAATVARHLGTDHHEIELRSADLPTLLSRLVWHYDEPFADAAAFPLLVIAEAARRHVKVVLTGEGGDELFGGYRRFAFERLSEDYRRLPGWLLRGLEQGVLKVPRARRIKQALRAMAQEDAGARAGEWLVVFDARAREQLVRSTYLGARDPLLPYREVRRSDRDLLNNLLYADIKTWLPDAYLEKVDKATMAVGLEARVPILDHELVEFAGRIPARHKIRGRQMKYVLKRAVADLLPPHILTRPKHGFSVPTDPWFRGELGAFARDLLLGLSGRARAYVSATEVARLLDEHAAGRASHETKLWVLLNLELWLRAAPGSSQEPDGSAEQTDRHRDGVQPVDGPVEEGRAHEVTSAR